MHFECANKRCGAREVAQRAMARVDDGTIALQPWCLWSAPDWAKVLQKIPPGWSGAREVLQFFSY
jgi:hypothetical protein